MSLKFRAIVSEGVSQISYLIGDDATREAAVIDPRPDVEVYLEVARELHLAITHIFETHIHADYMSGSRELASRCGSAVIYASGEGGAEYGFRCHKIRGGDQFEIGKLTLTAHHTPGHTPEHLSFLATNADHPDRPWAVFSGDALFAGSVGRPDLLGEEHTQELEERLYATLKDFYLGLDERVIVYPCHGSGSACGANISDRPVTTIGYEKQTNPFLQAEHLEQFRELIHEDAPPVPAHYPRLKKVNGAGPPVLGHLPVVPGMTPEEFRSRIEPEHFTLLDVRDMLSFGGGHIEGAINIGDRAELSVWAGDMLDPDRPLLLVLDDDRELPRIAALLLRTGFHRFAGYLAGGMEAWDNVGYPLVKLEQMTVAELSRAPGGLQIVDVRTEREWRRGHIPQALHQYVADLRGGNHKTALDKERPVVTYCGSGYRASIAASLLQRSGFKDVRNVPGSWQAWRARGLPVEK